MKKEILKRNTVFIHTYDLHGYSLFSTYLSLHIQYIFHRFVEELTTFDDVQLPESTLILVEPYLKKLDPAPLQEKTGNSACGALCKWVRGVVRYHRMMISKVKPLHQKVEETTAAVDSAQHRMNTLENKRRALEVCFLVDYVK